MAKNEARRQKQLAKKKTKRTEKRAQLARQTSEDPTIRLAHADAWPIEAALVAENLWLDGIGHLIIALRQPDGRLACAGFMVDVFCLGVKNAFWRIMSDFQYHDLVLNCQKSGRLSKVTPEHFAKLIFEAVEYARGLGFAPHAEFRHAALLLKGIDMTACPDTFTFGKNGKPFYVRGPHESLIEAQSIARRVEKAGGDYVIPVGDSPEIEHELNAVEGHRAAPDNPFMPPEVEAPKPMPPEPKHPALLPDS